jgi:hypothetical protein
VVHTAMRGFCEHVETYWSLAAPRVLQPTNPTRPGISAPRRRVKRRRHGPGTTAGDRCAEHGRVLTTCRAFQRWALYGDSFSAQRISSPLCSYEAVCWVRVLKRGPRWRRCRGRSRSRRQRACGYCSVAREWSSPFRCVATPSFAATRRIAASQMRATTIVARHTSTPSKDSRAGPAGVRSKSLTRTCIDVRPPHSSRPNTNRRRSDSYGGDDAMHRRNGTHR